MIKAKSIVPNRDHCESFHKYFKIKSVTSDSNNEFQIIYIVN